MATPERLIITEPILLEQIRRMYHAGSSIPDSSFEYVTSQYAGEWRWGVCYMMVVRDKATDRLWGVHVQIQTGDHYYCSLDEEDEARFRSVVSRQQTVYEVTKD